MPDPDSACSVRRESKVAANRVWASTSGGMPEPADGLAQDQLGRRRLHQRRRELDRSQRARDQPERTGVGVGAVERRRERRGPGRRAEQVDQVDDRLRLGVDQVERLPVAVGQVREVVHRLGDVVDRHHVGVAEVHPDQRQPRGQPVAEQLHQREEVVGAVDLVHHAGLAVADHDRRPVDPPRDRCLLADDPLRLVLRAVVGRGQRLALGEHGLVEPAVELARRRHRGHLVEAARREGVGELEGVAGAADVERLVGGVVGGHVVDRGEVEEVRRSSRCAR